MTYIQKIFRLIISALLASLGFSCVFYGVDEYGSPSATYKAKGVVVSESDDSPIEGICVSLIKKETRYNYELDTTDIHIRTITTAYTDSDGFFFLDGEEGSSNLKLYLVLIDVDGEINGSFERMEIEADYTDETFTGSSGNWYEGEAEIDFGFIKMIPE